MSISFAELEERPLEFASLNANGKRVLQPIINQQVGNFLQALDAEVQAAKAG